MTQDDDRRLEEQIRGTLQGEDGDAGQASLDVDFSLQLAAYLDGALDASELEAFEARLASSPSSRRWAMESARALHGEARPLHEATRQASEEVVPLPLPTPRPRTTWPVALAAGLAALMAGLWSTRQVESPTPSHVSTVADTVTANPSTEDAVQRALQGHLEPLVAFESLLDDGQRPVLRTSATDLGPAPLSPRWTLVSTTRPVFTWRATLPGKDGEIYLVDANETLVATLPFKGSTTPVTRLPLPNDVPDLEPGRLYAWKVNVHYKESVAASDYVPFQVMSANPASLDVESMQAGTVDDTLQHAARLAVDGRFDDALGVLQTLDPTEDGQRAEPLLAAIFEQQQLFPKLERLQRREMGWPDTPPGPPILGESTP